MTVVPPGREARLDVGGVSGYAPQRPEQTLLYQLVAQYYPAFIAQLAAQGRTLPGYVRREFEDFLRCGRLEFGFLRLQCERCHDEKLVAFSCKRRAFCPSCGARRMVDDCRGAVSRATQEQLPRVPRCWSTRSCRGARCASGC